MANPTSAPPPVKACNYCRNSHVACDGYPLAPCPPDIYECKLSDPRFRPKYPNSCTTSTAGNTTNHSKIDNTSPRRLGCSMTLGTGASDMGTSTSQAPSRPLEASGPWSRPERHHHMHDQHIDGLPCSDGDYDDDDDEDDDEDEEEQEQERWRKQSRDERSREAEPPPELASRMIAMMTDELHQLRKENAKLRRKVKKLRKEKRARKEDADHSHSHSHSNHNRGRSAGSANPNRPRYDDSPAATPQPQPQPAETWPSHVAAGECSGLIEARKFMPFLNHYRMSADTPFVVSDLHSYGFPNRNSEFALAHARTHTRVCNACQAPRVRA